MKHFGWLNKYCSFKLISRRGALTGGVLALITGLWLCFLQYSAAVYCRVLCVTLLAVLGVRSVKRHPGKIWLILFSVLLGVLLFWKIAPAYAVWSCCLLQVVATCINAGVYWCSHRSGIRLLAVISAGVAVTVLLFGIGRFDLFAQRGPLVLMMFACVFCYLDIRK